MFEFLQDNFLQKFKHFPADATTSSDFREL